MLMCVNGLATKVLLVFFLSCTCFFLPAQNVKLSGKVSDSETNSPVVGATVTVDNSAKGTTTDVDGRFLIQAAAGKKYTIKISNVGYKTKEITDAIADGSVINIVLEKAIGNLREVIITGVSSRKETVSSLYIAQKNSSSISDGISSEIIRRSPDKNTGEVLKRVSGASVQDNKFVVIRGLNERYNTALLNNSVLPSTELDKGHFLLTSSLLQ